jgi:DNA-binding SARP family transcriptional activator
VIERERAAYVQLLGGARAQVGAEQIPFAPDKRYRLLAYLAYSGDWVSRETVAFLFWPDTDDHSAKQNLRGLIKRVRALAWLTGLESDAQRLRWQVETDVAAFKRAVEEGRMDEAVSLYLTVRPNPRTLLRKA